MKILTLATFLILSATCFAGMRREPVPHAITSPDGRFVFTMLPGPKGQEHSKGTGICFKIESDGSFTEIWRTSGFYSVDLQLHHNGNGLVRIGSWSSGDQEKGDPKESLAVAFYLKGKEIGYYKVSSLVKDETKLQRSTAGLIWLEYTPSESPEFSPGEEIFQLETVDGLRYRFDMNTGTIIKNRSEQGGGQPATRPKSK